MSRILILYSFTLGVFSVGFWPALPESVWLILPLIVGFLLFVLGYKSLAWLSWGMLYGACWGFYMLSHQLPEVHNPSEFILTGEVIGLPSKEGSRTRFNFQVMDGYSLNSKVDSDITLKKLRLNWYSSPAELEPGQVWQLKVKLRRPRGTVNQGGFDYQAWLIRQGISATGYVRKGDNRLLSNENSFLSLFNTFFDMYRFHIRGAILKLPLSEAPKSLIIALTIGDRSEVTSELWDRLSLSRVVHLMVISGLHVGLVAYLFYFFGAGIARLLSCIGLCITARCLFFTARYWGSCCALLASVIYSGLAGLSLPTQRALVMISVAILAVLLDRKISRGLGFAMALSGVAIIDPLAFLSAGFWLSFGAAACLLWLIPVYRVEKGWAWHLRLKQFFQVQWLIFLVLIIPLVLHQLPIAWVSPLVNLLAIPWVSLVIVPLCLIGTVLFLVNSVWAAEAWSFAGWQLDCFIGFISLLSDEEGLLLLDNFILNSFSALNSLPRYLPLPHTPNISLVLIFVSLLVLLPRGIPGKYLSLALITGFSIVSVYGTGSYLPPLKVSVLDVGQGLSIVIQTNGVSGRHALVYDTGPGYGSGFNMGDAVVIPYLRYWGNTRLDTLVVSHGDNDHAGGFASLIQKFPASQVFLGEQLKTEGTPLDETLLEDKLSENTSFNFCHLGHSWVWDDVVFKFQHPGLKIEKEGNNRSCVLQITYKDQIILLPGDIESVVEHRLQHQIKLAHPVTLLVAPHHGSKTSSSIGFVNVLEPEHVVFSTGYRHHFGHPAKTVVQRYEHMGTKLWNTAEQGAIEFNWNERGYLSVTNERIESKRYWH